MATRNRAPPKPALECQSWRNESYVCSESEGTVVVSSWKSTQLGEYILEPVKVQLGSA